MNMNGDLKELLIWYGRTLTECMVDDIKSTALQPVLKKVRGKIEHQLTTKDKAAECAANAKLFWSEQPFLLSSFPIGSLFLQIASARHREGQSGEQWRHKGYIYSEDSVFTRSRVRDLFEQELAFVDDRSEKALSRVKIITFRDGSFDCTPSDLDKSVYSKEVEWLWFVWDSFDSITDEIREAIWSSSLNRIHRDYVCQIETANKPTAERDFEELLSKGWDELPFALWAEALESNGLNQ